MLIWIRANKDELVYTQVIINTFIALTLIMFVDYKIGVFIGFINLLLFLLVIVWNE